MQVMDAIYKCRAVRSFKKTPVREDVLMKLLYAAVQAPSAMNQQPWAFVIIEDRDLLTEYSNRAKRFLLGSLEPGSPLYETLKDRKFNIFYEAGTLVVICARSGDLAAAEDCCLAAENLMLAALDFGLATCPVGLARSWLNSSEVKRELNIPAAYTAVMPIVVGHPVSEETPPAYKRVPEVVCKRTTVTDPVTLVKCAGSIVARLIRQQNHAGTGLDDIPRRAPENGLFSGATDIKR
jgi:nitroreductase